MKRPQRSQRSDDGNAFLPESAASTGAREDLAELLAEAHQAAVISGQDLDDESHEALEPEEIGGPFIESHPNEEFGATRHEPIDDEFERSSLPEAVGGLAVGSPEEELEAVEAEADLTGEDIAPDAEGEPPSQLEPDPTRVGFGGKRR